jgi:DNA-binding CsgD family transcriptional regulator
VNAELDALVLGAALSAREVEVLALAAEGLSNTEIGARLHLSPDTIRSHFRRMARKLGTGDRTGMVAIAYRRRILAVPAATDPRDAPMIPVPAVLVGEALAAVSGLLDGRLHGPAYIRARRVAKDLRAVLGASARE